MNARDVIVRTLAKAYDDAVMWDDDGWRLEGPLADAVLAALADDGWRVVRTTLCVEDCTFDGEIAHVTEEAS